MAKNICFRLCVFISLVFSSMFIPQVSGNEPSSSRMRDRSSILVRKEFHNNRPNSVKHAAVTTLSSSAEQVRKDVIAQHHPNQQPGNSVLQKRQEAMAYKLTNDQLFVKHKNGHTGQENDKPVLFLHIGKAGGGTITEIMKYNNLTDLVDVWHPQGVLTKKTHLYHKHIMVNVRDPINRAISAINFDCMPKLSQTNQSAVKCCQRLKQPQLPIDERCRHRAALSDFFKGSANQIGQALIGNNDLRKERAELLINGFVHTKMSVSEHLGGIDTVKYLVGQGVKFYVVVLDDEATDFPSQVIRQMKAVLADGAKTVNDRVRGRNLKLPPFYKNIHESFSNYTLTTGAAARGFSNWFAKDYDSIVYLGSIGCGTDNEPCMRGIQRIVRNRRAPVPVNPPTKTGIFGISLDATKDMFPSFDMERTSEHARESIGGSIGDISSMFMMGSGTESTTEQNAAGLSAVKEDEPPPVPPKQPPPVPPPAHTVSLPSPSAPPPPIPIHSFAPQESSPPDPPIQEASNASNTLAAPASNNQAPRLPSSNNKTNRENEQNDLSSKIVGNQHVNEKGDKRKEEEQEDEDDENFSLLNVKSNYQVLGSNQQIVNILLEPNQSITCEPGVLVHCDPKIDISSQCRFSVARCISGEKQVMTHFKNRSTAECYVIGLTPNTPNSKVIPVDMEDDLIKNKLTCLRGAWLGSLGNADVSFQFDCRPVTCCFGGQGIRQQVIEGQGVVFLVGGGTVMRRVMERHERVVIDDHCLLAWSGTVGFAGRTASERCRDLLCDCTGEGVFNFVVSGGDRGGVIYIQTMPFPKYKSAVTGVGTAY